VLDSGLVVEVDGRTWVAAAGDRAWVPRAATHRFTNSSAAEPRFLEISFGDFDENDIERLEDDYVREP